MKTAPLVVSIALTLFGGFLCYKEEYEAAAGVAGALVATITIGNNDSEGEEYYKNLYFDQSAKSLTDIEKLQTKYDELKNRKNELAIENALLRKELAHQSEMSELRNQLIEITAKLENDKKSQFVLPEAEEAEIEIKTFQDKENSPIEREDNEL